MGTRPGTPFQVQRNIFEWTFSFLHQGKGACFEVWLAFCPPFFCWRIVQPEFGGQASPLISLTTSLSLNRTLLSVDFAENNIQRTVEAHRIWPPTTPLAIFGILPFLQCLEGAKFLKGFSPAFSLSLEYSSPHPLCALGLFLPLGPSFKHTSSDSSCPYHSECCYFVELIKTSNYFT